MTRSEKIAADRATVLRYLADTNHGHKTAGYVAAFGLRCSDGKARKVLRSLEADGLVEKTIVRERVGMSWGRAGSIIPKTYWEVTR